MDLTDRLIERRKQWFADKTTEQVRWRAQGGSWAAGMELERREAEAKVQAEQEKCMEATGEVADKLDEIEELADEVDDRRFDDLLVEMKDLIGALRTGYPRQR